MGERERQREIDDISEDEPLKALKQMKNGKYDGLDWIAFESFKKRSEKNMVKKQLKRLFNGCLSNGKVPRD